ncbi:hypothetical protein M0802_012570 [Mischocyttarus mexicanus]|nr:hypothetical protein M0802_012570 [Mischocyttarus mexicanus]
MANKARLTRARSEAGKAKIVIVRYCKQHPLHRSSRDIENSQHLYTQVVAQPRSLVSISKEMVLVTLHVFITFIIAPTPDWRTLSSWCEGAHHHLITSFKTHTLPSIIGSSSNTSHIDLSSVGKFALNSFIDVVVQLILRRRQLVSAVKASFVIFCKKRKKCSLPISDVFDIQKSGNVFVNELPADQYNLLLFTKVKANANDYKYVCVRSGPIFVKRGDGSKVINVNSVTDLVRLV